MIQVALTLVLILLGVVAYFYGAYKLAKYGFRLSTGIGIAVLLFPPYTFYFAFKKLEVDGKELPTALVSFGLVLTILLSVVFAQELELAVTGQFDELEALNTVNLDPGSAERDAFAAEMDAAREARDTPDEDEDPIEEEDPAEEDQEDADTDAEDEDGDAAEDGDAESEEEDSDGDEEEDTEE